MYGEYAHIFENVLRKNVQRVSQKPECDFRITLDDVVASATSSDMVVMVNPNNPTGQYLKGDQMIDLLKKLPEHTVLVVDETYIDFVGMDESVERLVVDHKNLIVLKSMSKIYALSGARVGYLAAHVDVIELIRAYIPPWSVSLVGQVAAVEALKSEVYYKERIAQTHKFSYDFSQKLEGIPGLTVYPSCANFILLGIKDTGKNARQICAEINKQNIYIRNATSMSSQFNQDFIRIAVRDRDSNKKIYAALQGALGNG